MIAFMSILLTLFFIILIFGIKCDDIEIEIWKDAISFLFVAIIVGFLIF